MILEHWYLYIDAYTLILVYWYLYFDTYVLTFIHQHLLVASITYHWCTYKLTLITMHDTCTYYIGAYTLVVLYLSIDTQHSLLTLNILYTWTPMHSHLNRDTYTLTIMHWYFIHWYLTFLLINTWTPIHCAVKHFFCLVIFHLNIYFLLYHMQRIFKKFYIKLSDFFNFGSEINFLLKII